ncbi:MAG: hypothetical protein LBJ95_00050 [Oscillospiraceae bacterium]|jgi:hypothetical protein|nr:hypothetical protein [Oscillospiraceae bacterium]
MKKILSLISAAVLSTCVGTSSLLSASALNFFGKLNSTGELTSENSPPPAPHSWETPDVRQVRINEFGGVVTGVNLGFGVKHEAYSGSDLVEMTFTLDDPALLEKELWCFIRFTDRDTAGGKKTQVFMKEFTLTKGEPHHEFTINHPLSALDFLVGTTNRLPEVPGDAGATRQECVYAALELFTP